MDHPPVTTDPQSMAYGGFWRRFIALVIDMWLISILVFPVIVAIDFFFPDHIVVTTPLNLFSEERVLETDKSTRTYPDGSQTVIHTRIVQTTYMGKWTYTHRISEESQAGESKSESQLIDPVTKQDIEKTSTDSLELLGLLIYLIAMEGSRHQATLGKLALGLRVVDMEGRRLTYLHAAGRNVSKLLSVFTLFIGFMMAGWTNRKQALHDITAGCLVVRARP